MKRILYVVLMMMSLICTVQASVLSQWRGPQRNGYYPDTNLLTTWPAQGPKLAWKTTGIGKGFSSVAVADGRVFATGMVGDNGQVSAFDLDGKPLWKTVYGPEWDKDYPGSRSTPTVVDEQLYIESGVGKVSCLDANKGTILWSVDMTNTFGAEVLDWGMVENLLVDGDRLICTPGGSQASLVALDRKTGKTIWTTESLKEKAGFCSPVLVQHGKRRLIITMTAQHIIGVDADNGKLLWKHSHITEYDVNPNTPIYQDGFIYAVSGYGTGGVKLQLAADGASVKEVWRDKTLDSQFSSIVLVNGFIYGAGQYKSKWHCLDWISGQIKYSSNLLARGNVIYADGLLYCYTERGELALVKPDPAAFKVVSSIRITEGSDQHWAHLVIAGKRLYLRHGDALLVYNIAQ